jgi:hypothetical protein
MDAAGLSEYQTTEQNTAKRSQTQERDLLPEAVLDQGRSKEWTDRHTD